MASVSLTFTESKDFLKLCSDGKLYEIANWIASGKPVHVAPESKNTPLQIALDRGFHSLVELLVRHETDQPEKERALKQAVAIRRFDLVELLVANGADPLSVPLADVLCEWNPEVVRFFLSKGADVVSGAPFAEAFRYKIRTAIGPYLEAKRAHPESAHDLQEQADRALRYFCYEGNLKWVSLLMWAGANPRSKGPSLLDWSDETDPDSFTTAIEEACSKGRLDILKRLKIDPEKDNLQEALKCAGWSGDEQVVRYLLELGVNPNDKPNGGSRALDQWLQKLSWGTWHSGAYRLIIHKWELTSKFNCLRELVKHKARWEPNDHECINDLRRILFKCDPEVTIELVTILKSNDASSNDTIRRLLSTPKMKSHIRNQETHLSRIGLRSIIGRKNSNGLKGDKNNEEFRVPYGLLRKYSREALYNEVWDQPMKILCLKYGISDVALAKVCKKLFVPLPGRGYWEKKRAGVKVKKRPALPLINYGKFPCKDPSHP
jgi:hypothetical protein